MSQAQWMIIAGIALLAISRMGLRLMRLALIVIVGTAIAIAAGLPIPH